MFSFDRSGFERHRKEFREGDLDVDLAGRVCLVTGANSGLGFETARELARRKASVHLLCRDEMRGRAALKRLADETGSRHLALHLVDLSALASVRDFVKGFRPRRVDVLVHNAGILPDQLQYTSDGLELTLATHVAGPYLLTHLLLPRLRRSGDPRVIAVSSGGMYTQRLDVAALESFRARGYDGVIAYARTKRAQVVMAELWAKDHEDILFASMHPGWADTPAVRTSLPRFWNVTRGLLRSPAEGADTIVWLAACERLSRAEGSRSGLFWFDREPRETHLLPGTHEPASEREAFAEALRKWAKVD